MATIEVKGKIGRIFWENKGLEIIETYKTKAGKEVNAYYTVWLTSPTTFSVGDEVKARGLYSHEISEWDADGETKRKVQVAINNPLVTSASQDAGFAPTHGDTPF
jgi:hypothetical protein